MVGGRRVLVTGSTQGIGLELACALRAAGASVVLHGLRRDDGALAALNRAESTSVSGGAAAGSVHLVTGDVAEPMPGGVLAVCEEVTRLEPEIDTLVCNAGTFIDQPFLEMDFAIFDRTLKLNVYSHYVLIQYFARRWVAAGVKGRIVLVGSINGRLSEPTHVAYDTSKGAVDAMVRSLCVSLAPHGIRVNGMAPGLVWSTLTSPALRDDRFRRWMELHTPNGRVPNADACNGAVLFLLSDGAEHVQGQMLYVDGGMGSWQQPDPPEEYR